MLCPIYLRATFFFSWNLLTADTFFVLLCSELETVKSDWVRRGEERWRNASIVHCSAAELRRVLDSLDVSRASTFAIARSLFLSP